MLNVIFGRLIASLLLSILSCVVYPYVYMPVCVFHAQVVSLIDRCLEFLHQSSVLGFVLIPEKHL